MRLALALVGLLLMSCTGASGSTCGTCAGCCDSSGGCQTGIQATACGTGGKACVACAAGELCSSSQHACGVCGASNCSGCCSSDGSCVVEVRDRDLYCGFNGAACVDCTALGTTCTTSTLGCK